MHDNRMKKILSKKRDLSPMEHSAKMDVVKQMRDMAAEEMGGKLDGLKKVSVMSNSPKGLRHGLDKAKNIVSNMDQMKNHAENDMGDDLAARQEHMHDESNHDDGSEASFADGGQVQDPRQSAQDSMRKAFGYNEGGEVEESPDEDESEDNYSSREENESDESPEEEQEESPEHEASESPEEEASEHDEFHGLDMDDLKDKLREMMQMHKSMGKK